jgi:ribosomal protein S18 acetylase RimI-like enzyme
MTPDIIRLTPANASLLDAVADEVFDEPVDRTRVAAYIADPSNIMLLAVADSEVVAQCAAVIHRHPDKVTELYIDEVGVALAFQRQGLATRMLDAMFAIGKEAGCGEAWVGTEIDNEAARRLYETRGGTTPELFVMYLYKL